MKNLKLIMILGFGLMSMSLTAQTAFDISYQTSLPLGEMTDHIDKYSWRGMGMEYQYFVNEFVSVGAVVGWNVFNQNTKRDYLFEGEISDADITIRGKQYRYVNAVPWYLTVSYYLGEDDGRPRPFASLGVGGTWIEKRTEVGLYAVVVDNVHFSVNPKIGVVIPMGYSSAFVPSIQYNLAPGVDGGVTYQYVSFNVGLRFQ